LDKSKSTLLTRNKSERTIIIEKRNNTPYINKRNYKILSMDKIQKEEKKVYKTKYLLKAIVEDVNKTIEIDRGSMRYFSNLISIRPLDIINENYQEYFKDERESKKYYNKLIELKSFSEKKETDKNEIIKSREINRISSQNNEVYNNGGVIYRKIQIDKVENGREYGNKKDNKDYTAKTYKSYEKEKENEFSKYKRRSYVKDDKKENQLFIDKRINKTQSKENISANNDLKYKRQIYEQKENRVIKNNNWNYPIGLVKKSQIESQRIIENKYTKISYSKERKDDNYKNKSPNKELKSENYNSRTSTSLYFSDKREKNTNSQRLSKSNLSKYQIGNFNANENKYNIKKYSYTIQYEDSTRESKSSINHNINSKYTYKKYEKLNNEKKDNKSQYQNVSDKIAYKLLDSYNRTDKKLEIKEKDRNDRIKREKEILEKERLERERIEKERKEKLRLQQLEREKAEKIRKERLEKERIEKEKKEKERRERELKQKNERQKREKERIEKEKLEQNRLRLEKEKRESERREKEESRIKKDKLAKEKEKIIPKKVGDKLREKYFEAERKEENQKSIKTIDIDSQRKNIESRLFIRNVVIYPKDKSEVKIRDSMGIKDSLLTNNSTANINKKNFSKRYVNEEDENLPENKSSVIINVKQKIFKSNLKIPKSSYMQEDTNQKISNEIKISQNKSTFEERDISEIEKNNKISQNSNGSEEAYKRKFRTINTTIDESISEIERKDEINKFKSEIKDKTRNENEIKRDSLLLEEFGQKSHKRKGRNGEKDEDNLIMNEKYLSANNNDNEDRKTVKTINISLEGDILSLNNFKFPKNNLPTKIKIYKCVNWKTNNLLNEDIIPNIIQKRNKSQNNNYKDENIHNNE